MKKQRVHKRILAAIFLLLPGAVWANGDPDHGAGMKASP